MAQTYQDTNVNSLTINILNKTEYDNLSQVSSTELYLVEEQVDSVVTQGSTNPVQSGAVYDALQDNHEIIFCHLTDGSIFNEIVIECTEINGEIFDPQELIDRPNDPRPLFPDGNYYYATNTNKVYGGEVGDNEFTDVTASVMMEGDETKLYCDIDDNKLYRYDGTNFVALTSNFSGDYNDLINNPFFVANNRLKYTDDPNTWVIPLMDDFSNNQNDYSKQILIYNGTGGIGPSMNIINYITDNDLLDYLPANYTIQDFVKAIADYYIQYKNDLLSGHNYFSVYGKVLRIRISPPEFYNYRFDYIKYNNDYIAKIEISALDSSYSAVGWYNNTTWTFEETTLKQVAFSGSYNDLTDKLLNATTTDAGLMSETDKEYINNIKYGYNVKNIAIPDYKCCLIADITTFWNSQSTTTNLPAQGFCGIVMRFRDGGNLNCAIANVVAMVSFQNNTSADHRRLTSTDSDFVPHILKYNNRYYISVDFGRINAHYLYMLGQFINCLDDYLIVNQSDCTLIV